MNLFVRQLLISGFLLCPNVSFSNATDDSRVSLEFFTHSEGGVNFPVMKSPLISQRYPEMFLAQQDVESFNWLHALVKDKIYNAQDLDAISAVVAKVKWVILRNIIQPWVESPQAPGAFFQLSALLEHIRGELGEDGFIVDFRKEEVGFPGARYFFKITHYEVCLDASCDPDTKIDIELEIGFEAGPAPGVTSSGVVSLAGNEIQIDVRKFYIEHAGLKMHLTPGVNAIQLGGWKLSLVEDTPKSELADGAEHGDRVIFKEAEVNLNLTTYIDNDDYSLKIHHYGSYGFSVTNWDIFSSKPVTDGAGEVKVTEAASVALEQADLITEIELKNIPEEFVDREAAFTMDAITVRDAKTAGALSLKDGFIFILLISLLNIYGLRWRNPNKGF